MTHPTDLLSEGLARVAADVRSVDLHDRALARSKQIGRRLTAWTLAGLAVAVATVGAGARRLLRDPRPRP